MVRLLRSAWGIPVRKGSPESSCWSRLKRGLRLVCSRVPLKIQMMVGRGIPSAVQLKEILSPSSREKEPGDVFSWRIGCTGGTEFE